MKLMRVLTGIFAICLTAAGLAQAATVSGNVTNKTTGKPSAGDAVELLDMKQAMSSVASTTTDAKGHFSVTLPGTDTYLVRVMHQGAGYYVSPKDGQPADVGVYDVATKVNGVSTEADVIEVETDNGKLVVNERFYLHNISSPPTTQWSQKSFEIQIPAEGAVTEVIAQRPGGLPTNLKLDPTGEKGHYSFNFPIQPDDGDKDTMFQVVYTLPYSGGKYTFKIVESLPVENLAVLVPLSMSVGSATGATFSQINADPGILTYLAKKVAAGQTVEFTVSGSGSIPRDQQANDSSNTAMGPGGGMAAPIATPDPLSKYKWWILGGLAVLFVAAGFFLLSKPGGAPAAKSATLADTLKEQLFSLESDRISGAISDKEYNEARAALDIVIKRAMKKG